MPQDNWVKEVDFAGQWWDLYDMAVSPDGQNIFLLDYWDGSHRLRRLDAAGALVAEHVLSSRGYSMALSPDGSMVFINHRNVIRVMNLSGVVVRSFSGNFYAYGQIALHAASNRLYVADSQNNRISVFDAATGEALFDFGQSGPGALSYPLGLAITPAGDVVVGGGLFRD